MPCVFFFIYISDVLVWSNDRVIGWITSIGLGQFTECFKQSGVHGAVIALDETFDVGSMTYFLQIPSTNTEVSPFVKFVFFLVVNC